jgi:hypothetical protein
MEKGRNEERKGGKLKKKNCGKGRIKKMRDKLKENHRVYMKKLKERKGRKNKERTVKTKRKKVVKI